jgi:hypothetical protein
MRRPEDDREQYPEKALRPDVRSLRRRYGKLESYVPVLEAELDEVRKLKADEK